MALLLQLTLTEKLHTIKTTTKSKMNQCRGKHYQIKQTVYTPLWRQAVKKKVYSGIFGFITILPPRILHVAAIHVKHLLTACA